MEQTETNHQYHLELFFLGDIEQMEKDLGSEFKSWQINYNKEDDAMIFYFRSSLSFDEVYDCLKHYSYISTLVQDF